MVDYNFKNIGAFPFLRWKIIENYYSIQSLNTTSLTLVFLLGVHGIVNFGKKGLTYLQNFDNPELPA